MKLESNLGDKPLWSQLFDILYERIHTGAYPIGETLPPELQLMDEFGVSRITIRQAMDKLLSEGLISRRRGKGTIVLEKKEKVSTIFQSTFSQVAELRGSVVREVVSVELSEAPSEVMYCFNLPKKTRVICLTRRSRVKEAIVTWHTTYISPNTGIQLTDDFSGSLYQMFQTHGYPIDEVTEEISASIISAAEKKLFQINKNVALMNRLRKGYHESAIVEYTMAKYLSEGYKLIINNK